jgi:AAA ATPase domain
MSENETVARNQSEQVLSRAGQLPRPALFVGRERELAILQEPLERTGSRGREVYMLSGEPGVGKTRLIQEIAERARATGWLVLLGHAYDSEGMPPYLPFVEALSDYVRGLPTADLVAEAGDLTDQLALLLPEVSRRHVADDHDGENLDPEARRYHLFESVSTSSPRLRVLLPRACYFALTTCTGRMTPRCCCWNTS